VRTLRVSRSRHWAGTRCPGLGCVRAGVDDALGEIEDSHLVRSQQGMASASPGATAAPVPIAAARTGLEARSLEAACKEEAPPT